VPSAKRIRIFFEVNIRILWDRVYILQPQGGGCQTLLEAGGVFQAALPNTVAEISAE
jgi:hypothetical protein